MLDAPVRLSTDNTERLSEEPLMYGTRSTWMGSNPATEPFLFVIASPFCRQTSKIRRRPATSFWKISTERLPVCCDRSPKLATISMRPLLADSANLVEAQWTDMNILSADIDAGEVYDHVLSRRHHERNISPPSA